MKLLLVEVLFTCCICMVFKVKADDNMSNLDRGLGSHIKWYKMDDALVEAKASKKPIMVIIHTMGCGGCKALKPKFAGSKEIGELSKHFVMVNLDGNEDDIDDALRVEGGYVPRIIFMNSEGKVQEQFYNEKTDEPRFKYFYPDAETIANTMRKIINLQPSEKPLSDEL